MPPFSPPPAPTKGIISHASVLVVLFSVVKSVWAPMRCPGGAEEQGQTDLRRTQETDLDPEVGGGAQEASGNKGEESEEVGAPSGVGGGWEKEWREKELEGREEAAGSPGQSRPVSLRLSTAAGLEMKGPRLGSAAFRHFRSSALFFPFSHSCSGMCTAGWCSGEWRRPWSQAPGPA